MGEVTVREVRDFLAAAAGGKVPSATGEVYESLRSHGAVAMGPHGVTVTPVGEYVQTELELRAYRADDLTLEAASVEIAETLKEMDRVAQSAESLLGEIGPQTPPESYPYMPISMVSLAHTDEDPGDLAHSFRASWGLVDVLEGDGRDRLLAASLLMRSGAPIGQVYGHLTNTLARLRASGGTVPHPVTSATVLHLYPRPTSEAALANWKGWKAIVGSDEAAALLAGLPPGPDLQQKLKELTAAIRPGGDRIDSERAGPLLLLQPDPMELLPRILRLADLLRNRLPSPLVAATLLVARHRLSPEELVDWVTKGADLARARRLAPTPETLTALAVALVLGLGTDRFHRPGAAPAALDDPDAGEPTPAEAVLHLLALDAWVYRRILEPAPAPPAASPSRPAA